MEDAFRSRERALENQFFRAVDRALVERMQAELAAEDARTKLREATGITNEKLLDELLDSGIDQATLVAFVLLPLAEVAWADGQVQEAERQLVVNTALSLGQAADSPGLELLIHWLDTRPADELFPIWCEYASRVVGSLSRVSQRELSALLLRRARSVATAAGGILGVGSMSAAERQVIQRVQQALADSQPGS